jgi:hypothetical protein
VSPEQKHHGVHPDDWEVDSAYSYCSQHGFFETRSMYDGSTLQLGNSDSEYAVSEYFSMSMSAMQVLNFYKLLLFYFTTIVNYL